MKPTIIILNALTGVLQFGLFVMTGGLLNLMAGMLFFVAAGIWLIIWAAE